MLRRSEQQISDVLPLGLIAAKARHVRLEAAFQELTNFRRFTLQDGHHEIGNRTQNCK